MKLEVRQTGLPGVLLIRPPVFADERGRFTELWRDGAYRDLGIPGPFVQDNAAYSRTAVLRGLHYQHPRGQGKLVSVPHGEAFDVAVDVRTGSPTFGKWAGYTLSGTNGWQLWIPPGFAHGYVVTGDDALVVYKCTEYYSPDHEGTIAWDDPALGIDWPVEEPVLSPKDRRARTLARTPDTRLPRYDAGP